MIDIIIPTLWKSDINKFLNSLNTYINCNIVNKIIIIDNDYKKRPKSDILDNDKISISKMSQNIFVNPAWNYGVAKSKSELICLLSDDVHLSNDVLNYISTLNFADIDIIGTYSHEYDVLELKKIIIDKNTNIGSTHYGFGCAMFMKRTNYTPIPFLYKIWYGDDYLIHHSKNVFKIGIDKSGLKFSETINSFSRTSYVKKRIQMDINNAKRFLFRKPQYK